MPLSTAATMSLPDAIGANALCSREYTRAGIAADVVGFIGQCQ